MGLGSKISHRIKIRNTYLREFFAEFLGTALLVILGDGSVAQYTFGKEALGIGFLAVNLTFGIAVTMGVYISAGVSGGHINPAVTLAMAIIGRLPWIKVPVYFAGQYLGAFVAAAVLYGVYYDALEAFSPGVRDINTAGIFATYPGGHLSTGAGFADQVVGTALLLICIMAITDDKNHSPGKGIVAISVGLSVFAIGAAFGYNCGYALNPARDLGPRILTAIAGWGGKVFTAGNNWAWVPVIAPHVGAVLGVFIYLLFIEIHEQEDGELTISGDKPTYVMSETATADSDLALKGNEQI